MGESANDAGALRNQLLNLMNIHPPHGWSTNLLAAVVAILSIEISTNEITDRVTHRPRLHII